jgi:three-Cys-motif partner protein
VLLGSPLLALTTEHPFTDYVFVDSESEFVDALQKRSNEKKIAGTIQCLVGDSNIIVNDIIRNIKERDGKYIRGRWSSINLAFLDPEAFELKWSTVETLASIERMDLIIYYPEYALNRAMKNLSKQLQDTPIDEFFGDRQWRQIYNDGKSKGHTNTRIHRDLMDLYKDKLTKLGYLYSGWEESPEPSMRTTDTDAPLYRLLFVCKHGRCVDFWNSISKKDVYGQKRLL